MRSPKKPGNGRPTPTEPLVLILQFNWTGAASFEACTDSMIPEPTVDFVTAEDDCSNDAEDKGRHCEGLLCVLFQFLR
jgi:hypothetical protein